MNETTIAVAIWDGVEELDVVGPYEVLTAWGTHANGRSIRVHTVAERDDEIRCAHGLRLLPDRTWDDVGEIDVLVLPGGNARPQAEDERVLARVRGLGGNGTLLTSVCTGALILAAAGLLEGRPATTHWSALESLAAYDGVEVRPGRPLRRRRRRWSPRPASPPASTWPSTWSRGWTRRTGRRTCGATSSTTPNLRYETRGRDRRSPRARGLVCVCKQRWPARRALDQGLRRGGPVLADDDARAPGQDGVGRVQDAVPRRPRQHRSTGKTTKSIRLRGPAIAVVSGLGSVWALDSGGTLYRLQGGKIVKRIALNVAAAYNIWIGGGSVWVAADQGASVVRVSPASNRVVARIEAGDGPASMAFDGANGVGREPPRHDDRPDRPGARTSPACSRPSAA